MFLSSSQHLCDSVKEFHLPRASTAHIDHKNRILIKYRNLYYIHINHTLMYIYIYIYIYIYLGTF
jgi:hypothetical protein